MWKIILKPKILSVFWPTPEQMRSSLLRDALDQTSSCHYHSSDLVESLQRLYLHFSVHSSHFVVWKHLQMFSLFFVLVLCFELGQSAEMLLDGQLPFSIWRRTRHKVHQECYYLTIQTLIVFNKGNDTNEDPLGLIVLKEKSHALGGGAFSFSDRLDWSSESDVSLQVLVKAAAL